MTQQERVEHVMTLWSHGCRAARPASCPACTQAAVDAIHEIYNPKEEPE